MARKKSEQILDEIKALRGEMEERMNSFDSRINLVAEANSLAANDEVDESEAKSENATAPDDPAASVHGAPGVEVPIVAVPETPEEAAEEVPASAEAPVDAYGSIRADVVDLVLTPLLDVSLARAVESALNTSEEIRRAALKEVRGDAAVIGTSVDPGVSVVTVLRSRLPVSFSLVDSDAGSVTIALAQPENDDRNAGAVLEAS